MGVEFQLVDDESKTYFDLGKGTWPEVFGESLPFNIGGAEQLVLLLGDTYKDIAPRVWKYIENHPKAELRNDYADDIPDEYRLAGTTDDEAQTNIGRTFAAIYGLDEENEDFAEGELAIPDGEELEAFQDAVASAAGIIPPGNAKMMKVDLASLRQRQADLAKRECKVMAWFTPKEIRPGETLTLKIGGGTIITAREEEGRPGWTRQWMQSFSDQEFDKVEVFRPLRCKVSGEQGDTGLVVEHVRVAGREQLAGPASALMFEGTFDVQMDSGKLGEFEVVIANPTDQTIKFMVDMSGKALLASLEAR